jgi:phosphatidylethanolamine-binding protein (PEBP) family uncharacterized protein
MRKTTTLVALSCLLVTSACSGEVSDDQELTDQLGEAVKGPNNFTIKVKSPDFKKGGAFDDANTCAGKPFQHGASPELYWSQGPAGTESYAIVLRDTSIADPNFSYHWAAWNIPEHIRHLPSIPGLEAGPNNPLPASLEGAQHSHARGDQMTGAWFERFFASCPAWLAFCTGNEADRVTDTYEFRVYALATADFDAPAYDNTINPNHAHRLAQLFEPLDLNAEPAVLTATSDAVPTSVPFPCP